MKTKTLTVFNRLETQRNEIIADYNRYTDRQLQFSPRPGHWNLLQVLRHLVTAEELSLKYIQRKLKNHESVKKSGLNSIARHFILKMALIMPLKFKAPKLADVTGENPDFGAMTSEWIEVRSEIKSLIENSDENILSKELYKHPRAGMLNIKQALEFFEMHINHHQKQIIRITSHASFPDN